MVLFLAGRNLRHLLACPPLIRWAIRPRDLHNTSTSTSLVIGNFTTARIHTLLKCTLLSSPTVHHNNRPRRRPFHQTTILSSNENQPKAPLETTTSRLRAAAAHENIWTIPNILTFSRLFAAPVIGYFLLHDQHLPAFCLFVYAGITDLLDGWIARTFHQGTVVGTIIDPMADKALMTIVTITLAANGSMPVYLAVLILGRDVLLAISAIYYRWISLPPPKTLRRYWDFSLPSAEVRPTAISKVNTACQLALIGVTVGLPIVEVGAWAASALMVGQGVVAVTTVWSGASYVYSKDAVKILSQAGKEEKKS